MWRGRSSMPPLVEKTQLLPSTGRNLSPHTNIFTKAMALTWIPLWLRRFTTGLPTLTLATSRGSRFNRGSHIFPISIVQSEKGHQIGVCLGIKTSSLRCALILSCRATPKANSLSRASSMIRTTNRDSDSKIVDPNTTTTSRTKNFPLTRRRCMFLLFGADSVLCLSDDSALLNILFLNEFQEGERGASEAGSVLPVVSQQEQRALPLQRHHVQQSQEQRTPPLLRTAIASQNGRNHVATRTQRQNAAGQRPVHLKFHSPARLLRSNSCSTQDQLTSCAAISQTLQN